MSAVLRLRLVDFRNYARLRLVVGPEPVVLTGPNGAGKTNLIEAVSFLTPGRGLRGARLSEVTRREAVTTDAGAAWAVVADLATPAGPVEVGTGVEPGSERRLVRIGGEPSRQQVALADVTAAVWLTPAMDRLFVEAPGVRRRFLDRLVFGTDPAHASRVNAYEKAMRERSRLLRDAPDAHGRGGARARPPDPVWLAALENTMAEYGVAVAAARREMVARLARACAEAAGPFPRAVPSLAGLVEGWLDEVPAVEAEERLRRALAAGRGLDARAGGALQGPHRSDLVVHHGGKGLPAAVCSTGEQKAVLIALVLAQARVQAATRGFPPMLLLDEIVAHLDDQRRRALFDALCGLGCQAWLTGTDPMLFAALGERAQFLRVDDAVVAVGLPPGRL